MFPAQYRRRAAALLATLTLLAAGTSACDDATGSVPDDAVGLYELVRVNGQLLPVRILSTPDQQVDVTSGQLVIRANGTYRETRNSRITDSEGTRTGAAFTEGTIDVSGSSVQVREREGGSYPGTWGDGTLTFTVPAGGGGGISFTYERS